MGASTGGAKGGYKGRNSRRRASGGVISDINVTPLVDVMLVLLIVFMVAAPMMTVGVPVQLPKSAASALDTKTEPLTISIQADKKIFLQKTPVSLAELLPKLQALAKNGTQEQVFIRADTAVDYGAVMEIMGQLNKAGYKKLGLLSSPVEAAPQPQVP